MDGRVDEILREYGLLNKSLTLVRKSLTDDGIDPKGLAISLTEWRQNFRKAVDAFIKEVTEEGETDNHSNGRRRKRKRPKTIFSSRKGK